MIDLDDRAAVRAVDASDALGVLEASADQWREAVARAAVIADLPTRHGITNVVWLGMGGSGIVGDALAAMSNAAGGTVPVTVVKGHDLPTFVGPNSLVVACSYSGNTEETIACTEQALARRARIVTLTSGGVLGDIAQDRDLARIAPHPGLQPRFAFFSMLAPALAVAERLSLLPSQEEAVAEATEVLEGRVRALAPAVPARNNEAKNLAEQLDGMLPWVWGQDGVLGVAAQRWRAQLNENAKVPALCSVLPELDHNELAAVDPGIPALGGTAVVVLRSDAEPERMTKRIEATLDEVRPRVGAVLEGRAIGKGPLAQLLSVAILGDFASVYLACRRGADPTQIRAIESLKLRLA